MRNSTWKQVLQENIDFRDSYFSESHCIPIKLTIKEKISTKSFFFNSFCHCNIEMARIFNKMWFSKQLLSAFGEDAFKLQFVLKPEANFIMSAFSFLCLVVSVWSNSKH